MLLEMLTRQTVRENVKNSPQKIFLSKDFPMKICLTPCVFVVSANFLNFLQSLFSSLFLKFAQRLLWSILPPPALSSLRFIFDGSSGRNWVYSDSEDILTLSYKRHLSAESISWALRALTDRNRKRVAGWGSPLKGKIRPLHCVYVNVRPHPRPTSSRRRAARAALWAGLCTELDLHVSRLSIVVATFQLNSYSWSQNYSVTSQLHSFNNSTDHVHRYSHQAAPRGRGAHHHPGDGDRRRVQRQAP